MSNPNNPWQGQFPNGQGVPVGYGQPNPYGQPPAAPVPPHLAGGYPVPGQMQTPQPVPVNQPWPSPQQYVPNQPAPTPQAYYGQQQPIQQQPYPAAAPQPYYPGQPLPIPVQPRPVQYSAPQPVPMPMPAAQPVPVPVPLNRIPAPQPVPVRPTAPQQPSPTNVASSAGRPIPVSSAARPIPVTVKSDSLAVRSKPKDEEAEKDIEEKVVKSAPPWLVSLVVHMVALIILGLIIFVQTPEKGVTLEVIYAEEIGVQLDDSQFDSPIMEQIEVTKPVFSLDTMVANDPFAAPPELPEVSLDGTTATDNISAPSIGMALTGREKGAKEALLGQYGGTKLTEDSVRKGLEWLKKNQEAKGTWSLMGPYTTGSSYENKVAATAMALLAFQGNGQTHKEGEYKREVAKAWEAMLAMQDKDGNFFHDGGNARLYSQAQATIAICEIYGMTKDPKFKHPAQLAVDYACKNQSPQGGWRYFPGQDSDTSVTGWFVIALQSAMMAGLEVPSPVLDKISQYLDSVAFEDGAKYSYNRGDRGPTLTMTAEALLCRQYLGWARNDPRLVQGVNYINDNLIQWGSDDTSYYWYYATQLTHHMEGEHWNKWNAVMREVIPKNQEKSGKEAGSWPPHDDRWAALAGGRLYQTCLCIYMLEVYYRHLPIYKWKAK